MMRDLKGNKKKRLKANKKVGKKEPVDWKGFFHGLLRTVVMTFSIVLVVVGAALSARVILSSGYFDVTEVRVDYTNRVDADEIVGLSDIHYGASIFSLDLDLIGRKIEENPWVAEANVLRVFPDQILIQVTERIPIAIINLDYLYYLDEGGEVFKVLSSGDSLDFPVITGVTRDEVVDASGVPESLGEALVLLRMLQAGDEVSLEDISEVHCSSHEGLTAYTLRRGVPIRFGRGGLAIKLSNLERIYAEIEKKLHGLKSIDLNVEDRVIVRMVTRKGIQQG
jgi:cell division protein FtsQ